MVGYSINHLVSDGMSFALMEETLSKLYEDPDREDMTLPNPTSKIESVALIYLIVIQE